jgi:tetratricopeptide (TPR) repeat protein
VLGESYGDITKLPKEQRQLLYERGWLLVHYLFMEPTRRGQLDRYLAAIASGTAPLKAAQEAFGDLGQLEKELNRYRDSRTLKYFKIAAAKMTSPRIDLRPLSLGASQAILLRGKLKLGRSAEEEASIAAQVRQIEAQFPGDPLVESTLSLAELKTEHAAAAEAAADRALKSDARNTEAMILKADAIAARASEADGKQRDALFEQARSMYIAANQIDTEDPQPLYRFYESFLHEGIRPNANAIAALHYASDLAPQDLGVRMNSAIAYLNEGKPKEARTTLTVVAYSPHSGTAAELARRMITDIDGGDARAALMELRKPQPQMSGGH